MKTPQMYRQGDVLIIAVASIPTGLKARNDKKTILAYGEVTGHHHRFEMPVTSFSKEGDDLQMSGGPRDNARAAVNAVYDAAREPASGVRATDTSLRGSRTDVDYIAVPKGGADLIHEEHDAIHVGEGTYKIVRQREYDMLAGVRRVAD